jgi:prolipoprotein diacylglyceryltransferase
MLGNLKMAQLIAIPMIIIGIVVIITSRKREKYNEVMV